MLPHPAFAPPGKPDDECCRRRGRILLQTKKINTPPKPQKTESGMHDTVGVAAEEGLYDAQNGSAAGACRARVDPVNRVDSVSVFLRTPFRDTRKVRPAASGIPPLRKRRPAPAMPSWRLALPEKAASAGKGQWSQRFPPVSRAPSR